MAFQAYLRRDQNLMDLTKSFPRSVKSKLAGLLMAARTTDKARAYAQGTLGEYHYNCPMDRKLFDFLGLAHEEFAKQASTLSDAQLGQWLRERSIAKKSALDIERFNASFLDYKPEPGSDGERFFLELRNSLDPTRTDITTWPDLLDLDERRDVPARRAA